MSIFRSVCCVDALNLRKVKKMTPMASEFPSRLKSAEFIFIAEERKGVCIY